MTLLKQLRGAYSEDSRMNLMHYCDLAADEIERLQNENALLKREVLAADTIINISGREMVVHSVVKEEIERLRALSGQLNQALTSLVNALAVNDEDGLTEFAEPMCAARAALRLTDDDGRIKPLGHDDAEFGMKP